MSKKYYCEKCKGNHLLNSDKGKKHRGIKVKKQKRWTYELIYPDGTKLKTTSIFNFKYAVIYFSGRCSEMDKVNGKYVSWHTDYRWASDLYVHKKDADHRIEYFTRDFTHIEYKGRREIEKMKIIKLDQKNFKKY